MQIVQDKPLAHAARCVVEAESVGLDAPARAVSTAAPHPSAAPALEKTAMPNEPCPSCGGRFPAIDGPIHAYMTSSPGCWARFGAVLAREYASPELMSTHRLSVDAYAVQHPGGRERRAVFSTGLHLARLMLQLEADRPPRETNDVMLALGRHKATLIFLEPPTAFAFTVADVPLDATPQEHAAAVRRWAAVSWNAWARHHAYIREWVRSAGDGELATRR